MLIGTLPRPPHLGGACVASLLLVGLFSPPVAALVTIDFTTFSGANTLLYNWEITLDIDGSGNVSVSGTEEGFNDSGGNNPQPDYPDAISEIDVIPFNVTDGVTVSGTLSSGFNESIVLSLNGAGNGPPQIRIDGDGTGIGVQGRNSGRIEWHSADPLTETLTVDVDLTGVTGSQFSFSELGIVSYVNNPQAHVVAVSDFQDAEIYANEDDSEPATIDVSANAGFSIASGVEDSIAFSLRDQPPEQVSGYALASLSFDLTPAATTLAGDYNDDGMVDAADYAKWRNELAGGGAGLENETVTPGVVDTADYDEWRSNYGAAAGSGAGALIPEPTTMALGMAVLVACGLGRGRRQR